MVKKENPNRTRLITLSNQAKELRQNHIDGAATVKEALFWSSKTVNYMLLKHIYDVDGATEFNTFNQWKEQGCTIKKGEKAFLVWGQPIGRQKEEESEGGTEEEDYRFFPLCYLFSNNQVLTREEKEREQLKKPEPAKKPEPVNLDDVL